MPDNTPTPQDALQILSNALETVKAMLAAQPAQAAEHAIMVESATKVDTLDEQIKALGEQKKEQVKVLLPLLHKLSGGKLTLANGHEVLAAMGQDKRVCKKHIVDFMVAEFGEADGKARAEKLWKSVPAKTHEYVTVKRPGQVNEEAEAPAPAATA